LTLIRDFSSSDEFNSEVRNIDSDAPEGMRQELIDLVFCLVEHNSPPLSDERIHRIICQSLGVRASGQPYSGFRYAAGRDLARADWKRVYDLICRLWHEFNSVGIIEEYRQGVNCILAANRVVWELTQEGRIQRYLPSQAQTLVAAAITGLTEPRFGSALEFLNEARNAFDDRPRRDRDACKNIFDAMESTAKVIFSMPNDKFRAVLSNVRRIGALQDEIMSVLEAINILRNRKFGHGTTTPFDLSSGEVDFTYLTCVGAILLFTQFEPQGL